MVLDPGTLARDTHNDGLELTMAQTNLPGDAAPLKLVRETGRANDSRLLTIVIGSYNHQRYLPEAFAAIEASKVCDRIALLFIDDGSSDDTMSFVSDYDFDPTLHVRFFIKHNAGLRDSLASGLALTDTRFVAFIASDDFYDPLGLRQIVERLANQGTDNICWICQATYLEGREGDPVYGVALENMVNASAEDRLRQLSISYPKPLLLQSTVFATDMLRTAQPWQTGVRLDDWPTFVQVAALALNTNISMLFLNNIRLCHYRLHAGGAHNNVSRQLSMCLEVANNVISKEYRRDTIAHIHMDIGLIHLFNRNLTTAMSHFAQAIASKPSLEIITLVPRRLASSAFRRFCRLTNNAFRGAQA